MNSTIFWNVTPCSLREFTDILEESTDSIFVTEEEAKQGTGKEASSKRGG
jgi:hypothetical protein